MKRKLLYIIPAIALSFALLAAIPYMGAEKTTNDGYKVGDAVLDFHLKNTDGKMLSMHSYKHNNKPSKGFIVAFTCNHCPYAKLYEQRIIELHTMFADKGYPVIAINPNDPTDYPEDSFEKMQEKNYAFPYLLDETQEVAHTYGATKTPHIYILNKEHGGYRIKYIGAIDNSPQDASKATEKYVEDAINALIAGNEVSKTTTKAIGCSIKWKDGK